MEDKLFFLDNWKGKAKGAIYYRDFDFIEFLKKVEEKVGQVVGLKITDDHNIEIITELKKSAK
jgi:hypothetical protein